MVRVSLFPLVAGAAALAACQQAAPSTSAPATSEAPAAPVGTGPGPAASGAPVQQPSGDNPNPADPLAGENDGVPDLTPAPLTGDAIRSETGARSLLLAWARAIELREFDQAWSMMGDGAKAQISKAQFNALFHPLRDITVAVPGGDSEGAAGSTYYTVPTTVTGTRADGSKAALKGDVILRRVNDVDGASPAQLRWHFDQINLKPG